MRLRLPAIAAVAVLSYLAIEHRHELPALPDPTSLLLSIRNEVPPYRFTLATEPEAPACDAPITLRVHVVNPQGQPLDNLEVEAGLSVPGTDHESQHLTLRRKGKGDYEGKVQLEVAGSWNVDLMATKDGEARRQRLSLEVGSAKGSPSSQAQDQDDDDS
jgi:hypothetical protein